MVNWFSHAGRYCATVEAYTVDSARVHVNCDSGHLQCYLQMVLETNRGTL